MLFVVGVLAQQQLPPTSAPLDALLDVLLSGVEVGEHRALTPQSHLLGSHDILVLGKCHKFQHTEDADCGHRWSIGRSVVFA